MICDKLSSSRLSQIFVKASGLPNEGLINLFNEVMINISITNKYTSHK